MLKIRAIGVFAAGLLALGVLGGCSNSDNTDASGDDQRGASDSGLAATSEVFPSQVFIDLDRAGSRIVAVGESGAIRVSDDNGSSWRVVSSGVNSTLTAVSFVSDQTGWAVGHDGTVLRTDSGGDTWESLHLDQQIDSDQALMDVAFDSQGQGIIVGPNRFILTTLDGGENWTRERLAARSYGSDLNGVAILESGHQLIVTDGSDILSRSEWGDDWQVFREGYKPLLGVIGLGGSEALAFGAEGTVMQSPDGGVSWNSIKSASKVGYFGGRLLSDGSVILVGSEGIVARRAAGGEMFYPELDLPLGALTGVAEGENNRLLLAGIQGVGYGQDNQYWFHGVENGATGQLMARSLLGRVETSAVLQLAESGSRSYQWQESGRAVEWVEISLSAAGAGDDVLTPAVFNGMGEFFQEIRSDSGLPLKELRSVWDDRYFSYLLLQGPYGYLQSYPMVPDKPGYSEAERPYLERRLKQAALLDSVVSSDYSTVTIFADVPSHVVAGRGGADQESIHEFLAGLTETPEESSRPFNVSGIETIRLEEVDHGPKVENGADSKETNEEQGANEPGDYLYVISHSKSYGCEKPRVLKLADSLAGYLKKEDAPGPVLSVADLAKLNQVSRKDENWKWYTTSGYRSYGNEVYRLWEQSYCPNPLAIVFGHRGDEEQGEVLEGLLEQFGGQVGLDDTAEQLEMKTYRVRRSAI